MRTTRSRNIWLLVSAVWIVTYSIATHSVLAGQLLWTLFALTATAVVLATVSRHHLWARSAWLCVAAAIALSAIITVIRGFRPAMTATTTAESLLGGLLYSSILVLLILAALLFVNRRRRNTSNASTLLDSAIVFVAATMVYAQFLVYPFWFDSELQAGQLPTLVAISVGNLVLLSVSVRIWFSTSRSINRSARILAPGLAIMAGVGTVGLSAFLPTTLLSFDLTTDLTYGGTLVFFALAGAAVLDPTAISPPAGDVDAALASRARVLVLMGSSLLLPAVLLWLAEGRGREFTNGRPFIVLTVTLAVLLGFRINLIIQSYREAVRREHLLGDINAALMRITDLASVNDRLSDWASRLVEQSDVTCVLGTNDELASAGLDPRGGRVRLPNGETRYRTVVSIPGSKPPRRLVIDSPESFGGPAQASLSVLGQSLGMALERIALSKRVVERATTERLQLLLHNASDVITLVDDKKSIRYVTEAIRDLAGQSTTDVLGSSWPKLFQDQQAAIGLLDRARAQYESKGELVMRRRRDVDFTPNPQEDVVDPSQPPEQRVEVNVTWVEKENQYVVTLHDVTDRYLLEQKLTYQAFHDELTGLNNRIVFRREMARAAARSRRSGQPFAVLMMDLDDFKQVNDSLGHPTGDELLRVVANRLVTCMREGDTPVRLGGDEFAAILESATTPEHAELVADRVLTAMKQPIQLAGTEVVSRASIGIAMNDGSTDAADTERHADIALYDAKFAGKSQVKVFETDLRDDATDRLSLSNQLRGALARDELFVKYQPIAELTTNAVVGAEALVRWAHPTRGELRPKTFIGIAEQEGTIVEIGRFVMRTALQDFADLLNRFPEHRQCKISINISGRQLQSDNIADALAQALAATKVPAENVIIEVTESVFMPDDGAPGEQLRAIAALGVAVFIDDFGTGWASLHYLRTLPVSGLKLAREFVAGLPNDFDFGLAQAIRELSASMNLSEVIAEGIETPEQRKALISMGYRIGQGFLLDEPKTVSELADVLATRSSASWRLGIRTDIQADGSSQSPTETPSGTDPKASIR
ncbi:MAG: diguanylate cyclase (GGDEF)-like protein/PAS domain S-box-containing protein [Actinomycetes bacterium]|jgi:diguanylate cyclase (GGDEF)-like protein/PAS domain S-box-containing protein